MIVMNKNNNCYSIVIYVFLFMITCAYAVPINPEENKLPPNYELGPKIWLVNPEGITEDKMTLTANNIDINDINALKKAATSNSFAIRQSTYRSLVLHYGSQAIPILQGCLDKANFRERVNIARYLALAGDQSGLKKLRDDIIIITKYEDEINSPKAKSEPNKKDIPPFGMRTKSVRLANCLYAAISLADFGDTFGYELAAKLALESEIRTERSLAMQVLTKLTRIDKAEQKVRRIDPEAVLLKMAETEKDPVNLEQNIPAHVLNDMRPESQIRIFEKLIQSPYISGEFKEILGNTIKRLQKQLDKEKQAKEVQQEDANSIKK
jgi:hypothetical protein